MTLTLVMLDQAQQLLGQTPTPAPQPTSPTHVPWQTTMAALGSVSSAVLAATVAVVSTRREHAARTSRDKLADEQAAAEHRRAASLVSAWVDEGHVPNPDGRTYTRLAAVHIANEGDQPVFDLSAQVGVGFKTRSIGPLAVPNRIPVLPPRRERVWDITLPLLAHPDTESPCAAVIFTDPAGARWRRAFDGSLTDITGNTAQLIEIDDHEAAIAQLGNLDHSYNPMAVAVAFLGHLQDPPEEFDLGQFQATLAPEATGWQQSLSDDALRQMRADLADYSFGTMPYYPVPHVAYVKLIHNPSDTLMVVSGEGDLEMSAKFLTLTFADSRGWRVFGFGRIPAERIQFPPETLPTPAQLRPAEAAPRRRWPRRREP